MKNSLSREARFNRYFEGYQKRTVIDRNGEEKVKFVYTLDYYRPQMSQNSFIIRKVIYIVLFLIAAAVQLLAGLQEIPMNHVQYMGFAQCLGILAMILIGVYLCIHLTAPYTMEVHAYRGAHEKFITATLIASIGMGVIFLCALVTMIICSSLSFRSVIWVFLYLVAAGVIFVMWMLEKKTEYDQIPQNETYTN